MSTIMATKNTPPETPSAFNLKNVMTTITGIVSVLGAFWAIDNHYASAADVQQLQRSMETQVRMLRQERTEDELLKLDAKKEAQNGKLSPEEEAMRVRYVRRLKITELEQQAADLGKK